MTDQQRWDMLHATAGGPCESPGLDRLAGRGVSFTNAHTVCALCTPARASIFTGVYPHTHGLINNCDMFSLVHRNLPHREMFLHPLLAKQGYSLGYFGKWHIDSDFTPMDEGFEGVSVPAYGLSPAPGYDFGPTPMRGYEEHLRKRGLKVPAFHPTVTTDRGIVAAGYIDDPVEATVPYFLTEKTIEFVRREAKAGKPFFATLQFWGPHEISKPTRFYLDRYSPESIPLWGSYGDDLAGRPYQYLRHRDEFECWYHGVSRLGEAGWRRAIASYFAHSTMIDVQIARLLDELASLGIEENTVIAYCSDHGNYSGARGGLFDKGVAMFEDIYHIPMFFSWPGVTSARTQDQLVSHIDIMPTFLEIAGATLPKNLHGQSLVPILQDPGSAGRDAFIAENHGTYYLHDQRMVVSGGYKYVFTPYDRDELYDLKGDPYELHNLIDDAGLRETRARLRRRLFELASSNGDPLAQVVKGYHVDDVGKIEA